MERVAIIGPGGAGKSTLARQMGELTGLPVIHLDREHWRPGWVATPEDEWVEHVTELAAGERWIMDGNYGGTLENRFARADTVIYLDFDRFTCIRRVLKRRFQYRDRGRSRPDMADGCEETVDPKFLWWLWTYPAKRRAETLGLLAAAHREGKRVVILRDAKQVRAFVSVLASGAAPRPVRIDRVNLVGATGAGKTTLGTPLSQRVGLPGTDLGTLLGAAGHSRANAHAQRKALATALREPRWILEGVYWLSLGSRLEAGDLAIFLDRSASLRIRRILRRRRGPLRSELRGLVWALLFPLGERRHVVRILARAAPTQPVFVVRTDAEAAAVLEGLAPAPPR